MSCDQGTNTNVNSSDSSNVKLTADTSVISKNESPHLSDSVNDKAESIGKNSKVSPKLVSLTATFHTTDNDKDWNTQIGCTARLNGHVVGEIFCCSTDRKDDHYDDNFDSPPIYLNISERPTKDELNGSVYEITAREVAGGTDEWHFDARLNAKFDDGS